MRGVRVVLAGLVGLVLAWGAVPGAVTTASAAVTTIAGGFTSLPPSRILDTRTSNGATGPVRPNGTVALQVTGRGGVPASNVSAIVMNVTVTDATSNGFVTVFPFGAMAPNASNLNFGPGQTVPNLVTVQVGAQGKVSFQNASTGTVSLVADVAGYYLGGTPTAPGAFVSLAPSRLLDTRVNDGALGPVPANGSVTVQVTGRAGIPSTNVAAVVLNVTVTDAKSFGFVTVYPGGTAKPNASNLNYATGQTVPNLATVKVGATGAVTLFNTSSGSVSLVADVAGYYLGGTPTAAGAFVPLAPTRLLDTRVGLGGRGPVARDYVVLQVTGRGGIPASGVAGVVMNVTATEEQTAGFVTVFPNETAMPNASNLNFGPRQTIANLAAVKLGGGGRVVFVNQSTNLPRQGFMPPVMGTIQLVGDAAGYFIGDTPPLDFIVLATGCGGIDSIFYRSSNGWTVSSAVADAQARGCGGIFVQ